MEPDDTIVPRRRIKFHPLSPAPAGRRVGGAARSRITGLRVTVSEDGALNGEGSLT